MDLIAAIIMCFILVFYLHIIKKKNVIPHCDFIFILSSIISYIIIAYIAMFYCMDVPPIFDIPILEKEEVIFDASIINIGFILGGIIRAFSMRKVTINNNSKKITKKINFNILSTLIIISIILILFDYYLYFKGMDYAYFHSQDHDLPHLLLSFYYVICAATIILVLGNSASKKVIFIIIISSMLVLFTYGYLFEVRNPLLGYFLIILCLFGDKLSFRYFIYTLLTLILILAIIPLNRDSELSANGNFQGLIDMLLGVGQQVNSINFSNKYVKYEGITYGLSFLKNLIGSGTPSSSLYTISISPEYFQAGGGYGFFLPSDLIINFGLYGAFIFAIFFGYIFGSFNFKRNSYLTNLAYICVFSATFTIIRNDFGTSLRGPIYIFLMAIALKLGLYAINCLLKLRMHHLK